MDTSRPEHLVTRVLDGLPRINVPITRILMAISWRGLCLGQSSALYYKEFSGLSCLQATLTVNSHVYAHHCAQL